MNREQEMPLSTTGAWRATSKDAAPERDGDGVQLGPTDLEGLSTAEQEVLAEVLDRYLTQLEHGQAPDVDGLLRDHPRLAGPLRGYLDSLQLLHRTTRRPLSEKSSRDGIANGIVGEAPGQVRELGDYRLLREIGRGGMGIVYEAWQLSLDRRVALKMLPFASVLDPKHVARFQNEVRAAAQLLHPHIVPVFGVGCERGVHYYSMQFIDGQPLDEAIRELRRLPEAPGRLPEMPDRRLEMPANSVTNRRSGISSESIREETRAGGPLSTVRSVRTGQYVRSVVALAVQAAEALQHAHDFGIVHRDIKPSNLLVDRNGQLWVTDFGLARVASDVDLTVTGDLVGTVRYMSPEQAAGRPALVDHRTDIYSLGVTLYELLTLRPAFPGNDRPTLLRQIERESPSAIRRLNSAVSVDLETILLRATHKDREQRYLTAGELAADLRRFLEGRAPLAHRPTWWERTWSFAGRHRRGFAMAAAASLLGLIGCAAGLLVLARQERATRQAWERAERHLQVAKRVVDRFGAQATEDLAEIAGAEQVRDALLTDAVQFYEELREESRIDPLLSHEAATAAFKAAVLRESLGQFASVENLYGQARERFAAGSDPAAALDMALCDHNLALVRWKQGDLPAAEMLLRRALQIQGDWIAPATRPLELDRRRTREMAATRANLAGVELARGRRESALPRLRESIAEQRQWLKEDPTPLLRRQFAANCRMLAEQSSASPAISQSLLREASEQLRILTESSPSRAADRADLALCRAALAQCSSSPEDKGAAEEELRAAIRELQTLTLLHPRVARFRVDLATLTSNWGSHLLDMKHIPEAEAAFQDAQRMLAKLCEEHPELPGPRSLLANTLHNLGWLTEQQQRWTEAAKRYAEAAEHQQAALASSPESIEFRELLENHRRGRERVVEGRRATAKDAKATEASPESPHGSAE